MVAQTQNNIKMNLKKLKKVAKRNVKVNTNNVETHIIQLSLYGYSQETDDDCFTLLSGVMINTSTATATPFSIPATDEIIIDLDEETAIKAHSVKLLLDYLQSKIDVPLYDPTVKLDIRPEVTVCKLFN